MKQFLAVGLVCALAASLPGRQEIEICGTHPASRSEALFLHRQSQRVRRLSLKTAVVPEKAAAQADQGDIAVLEDANGIVAHRHPFDLNGQSILFTPSAAGYRFQTSGQSYDSDAAAAGTVLTGLGDDDTRLVALPFAFPFYGQTYRQIYVNSDGNLSFTQGDNASVDRSLGRVVAGVPRVSPLYRDLDPTKAVDGVRVTAEATRFVVSWAQVPEFADTGRGALQTFQARLYPDGRIEFAYQSTPTLEAVVGISPGGLTGAPAVLSFTSGSSEEFRGAITERFTATEALDIVTAAQQFYQTHEDSYDYLVFYNTLSVQACTNAVACESTVRTVDGQDGIGDNPPQSLQNEFGSARRLQAVLNMGPLSQYPVDPNALVTTSANRANTPLTVLGHEAGHLFLAYASVRDPQDPAARPMLGRSLVHWSFNFNSEASLLEGNRIQDNGQGAAPRFMTTSTTQGYAPLDQYLMGFRPPEEVPATFLVQQTGIDPSRSPQKGVSFNGTRREVTIEELIQTEHPRVPDSTVAQRHFRFGFVLVVPAGTTPAAAQVQQLDTYRRLFVDAFARFAEQRATADTSLRRSLGLSLFPASGVVLGTTATASVHLPAPVLTDLTLLLQTQRGFLQVPASVTVPAGATSVQFSFTGTQPGVEEFTVTPANDRYETAHVRVPVQASAAGLTLRAVAGDQQVMVPGQPLPQPVVLQVTDANRVPYAGVAVTLDAGEGGQVFPVPAVTDEAGQVAARWTPGSPDLRASLAGQASQVVAHATGLPTATAVVNAASFAPGIVHGGLATIFGTNLVAGILKPTLADVQIAVDGQPAPVLFASDRQINFFVPVAPAAESATITLTTRAGSRPITGVPVRLAQPGLFGAHAVAGGYLELYATGVPALPGFTPAMAVTIGGRPAEVVYRGPLANGLYQVNVRVPAGAPAGPQPLVLTVADVASNVIIVTSP